MRSDSTSSDLFVPARWLPGRHAQTMWGQMTRSRKAEQIRREIITTPDGDEVILDHNTVGPDATGPRLLILHGLEGSSFSVYAQGFLGRARRRSWPATVIHFRTCARRLDDRMTWLPNKRPRFYHSGDTGDLDLIARAFKEREPKRPLFAVGVSLGGNVLLKWMADHSDQRLIERAATISVPYDLEGTARNLSGGASRLYLRHFFPSMLAKLAHMCAMFPELREVVDLDRARRAKSFYTFDDAATAPLAGFDGALDYYRKASSLPVLCEITTPTLCVSAADDPFLPPEVLERARNSASPDVETAFTDVGGHVGFVGGPSPRRPVFWAEERIMRWFE